jgi:Ca-activated chloride channel family protein
MAGVKSRLTGLAGVLAVVLAAVVVVFAVRPRPEPCRHIALQLSSSTEKASGVPESPKAMDEIVRAYHAAHRTFALADGDGCADISLTALTSGTAERALATNWTGRTGQQRRPDVWLPTSSAWVALLRHEQPGAAPEPQPGDSLAQSPLVLAMPRSKATAFEQGLRDNGDAFDWSLLDRLVVDGKPLQWGQDGLLGHGKPRWRGFALTKDDPVESTSGLFALIAVAEAAAAGGVPDAAIPEYLRRVERLVPDVIDPDGTQMMRTLRFKARCESPDWGDATSAVIIQESLMYQYDTDNLGGIPNSRTPCPSGVPATPEDLVPIYSRTNWVMDHPFVRLPGLTAEQRAAADDLLAFIRTEPARRYLAAAGLRDGNGERFAAGGLTDLNTRIGGGAEVLPQRTVATGPALDGAAIAAIRDRWLASRKPVHLLVAIDESGTMNDPGSVPGRSRMAEVRDALKRAQAWLGRNDEFSVVGFAARSKEHGGTKGPDPQDLCRHVCTGPDTWKAFDDAEFGAAIGGLTVREQDNDTPLYQAIMGAQQRVAARRQAAGGERADDIYAVVVMTDGKDDYWRQSVREVLDNPRADVAAVPVYPVCFCVEPGQAAPLEQILRATTAEQDLELDVTKSLSAAFAGAFATAVRPSYRAQLGR